MILDRLVRMLLRIELELWELVSASRVEAVVLLKLLVVLLLLGQLKYLKYMSFDMFVLLLGLTL